MPQIAGMIKNLPFELSDADLEALGTRQEDSVPHSWGGMKEAIARGDISSLRRNPNELRNYLQWTKETQAEYGSVTEFILRKKLHWQPYANDQSRSRHSKPLPLTDSSDFRVLRNDWPYGMTRGISHLIVWSKTPIPVDAEGVPTPESCQLITKFIHQTFTAKMPRNTKDGDGILWFKNRKR